MLRTSAAALVAAAALSVPAHADPPKDTQFVGDCRFRTVMLAATGSYDGTVDAVVAAVAQKPEHNPVALTALRCLVRVNGTTVFAVSGTTTGPVGVVPPAPVSFVAADSDYVLFCMEATAVDAHGQRTDLVCGPDGDPGFPPLEPLVESYVDPAVCPVLASLAPTQVQNHLRIDEQGDVYLAGELWWDCPPYQY